MGERQNDLNAQVKIKEKVKIIPYSPDQIFMNRHLINVNITSGCKFLSVCNNMYEERSGFSIQVYTGDAVCINGLFYLDLGECNDVTITASSINGIIGENTVHVCNNHGENTISTATLLFTPGACADSPPCNPGGNGEPAFQMTTVPDEPFGIYPCSQKKNAAGAFRPIIDASHLINHADIQSSTCYDPNKGWKFYAGNIIVPVIEDICPNNLNDPHMIIGVDSTQIPDNKVCCAFEDLQNQAPKGVGITNRGGDGHSYILSPLLYAHEDKHAQDYNSILMQHSVDLKNTLDKYQYPCDKYETNDLANAAGNELVYQKTNLILNSVVARAWNSLSGNDKTDENHDRINREYEEQTQDNLLYHILYDQFYADLKTRADAKKCDSHIDDKFCN